LINPKVTDPDNLHRRLLRLGKMDAGEDKANYEKNNLHA
jgi:hypothetical protein